MTRTRLELLWIAALASLVLVVHDVNYMLSAPYWLDESWVAITGRYPLHDLPATTSSTPILWSLMLRPLPQSDLRIVPLLFAGLAVAAAYLLVRGFAWERRSAAVLGGSLAGVTALVNPSALVRNDLKQYTADAFFTLLVLLVVSGLEATWSQGRLIVLAVITSVGLLLSAAAALTGIAAFAALAAQALARRDPRLKSLLVIGAAAGAGFGALYLIFVAQADSPGLTKYWMADYLPVASGPVAVTHFLHVRVVDELGRLGVGPWWLAACLIAAGLVALLRRGRPMVALTAAFLLVEMLALGALKIYPFLDQRTSHFLTVMLTVITAVGVSDAVARLLLRPAALGAALTAAAVAFTSHNSPYLRAHSIAPEDVRAPAAYLQAHRAPGEVVIVTLGSSFGFGVYWRDAHLGRRHTTAVLQGYVPDYPQDPALLIAAGRDASSVNSLTDRALSLAHGSTIWMVDSHVSPGEDLAWANKLTAAGLQLECVQGLINLYRLASVTGAHPACASP